MNLLFPLFALVLLLPACGNSDTPDSDGSGGTTGGAGVSGSSGGGGSGGSGGSDAGSGGGSGSGAGGEGGMGGASASGLHDLAQAVCSRQASCCAGNQTLEACVSGFTGSFAPIFTLPGIAVDPQKLAACLAAYAGASCDTASAYGGEIPFVVLCPGLYAGTLADGAACGGTSTVEKLYGGNQCQSGSCSGGKCAAPASEGAVCSSSAGCVAGTTCYQGTCLAVAQEGQDCSQKGLCDAGLDCVPGSGVPAMTCVKPTIVKEGEDCGPGRECELGKGLCVCPAGSNGSCPSQVCGRASYCKP